MNIAFITCFYKTIFFKQIADDIVKYGYNVYWISTSKRWSSWLINQGVKKEDIMILRKDFAKNNGQKIILSNFENETSECIRKLYYMDRVISKWDWEDALKYVNYIILNIEKFLNDNRIEVVFGEATAMHEIITAIICKKKNISFLCPHTLRIPSNRFVFFKGYLQSEFQIIEKSREKYSQYKDEAFVVINKIINEGMKPNYWHWLNIKPKYNISMLKTLILKIIESVLESKTDATVKPLLYHLTYEAKYLKPTRNYLTNKLKIFEEPKEGEKYVLYTLHKQPEASIDVLGVNYQNQLELIKRIAISLPNNLVLYVKEHANCLGERSISELRRIKRIPGVRLINPLFDIHKLIKESEAVITVSGTAAFEAGLYNKTALTLSRMFFNILPGVYYLDNIDKIRDYIKKEKYNIKYKDTNIKALAFMIANSFEGIIGDPKIAPICMNKANILSVSKGFIEVLSTVQRENGGKK